MAPGVAPAGQLAPGGRPQARGQRRAVRGRYHQRGIELGDRLRQPADGADDARRAARGRLEHDQAEALDGERRHDGDVCRPVDLGQLRVRDPAEHPHPAGERRSRRSLGQLAGEWSLADHQQGGAVRQLGCDHAPGLEQHVDPHARDQAPRAHGDERLRREPQSRACGCAIAGGERVEVDARWPDVHVPGGHPVALHKHAPEGAGERDVRVCCAKHPALERPAQHESYTRGVACEDALVRPRPVKVEHLRSPAHVSE